MGSVLFISPASPPFDLGLLTLNVAHCELLPQPPEHSNYRQAPTWLAQKPVKCLFWDTLGRSFKTATGLEAPQDGRRGMPVATAVLSGQSKVAAAHGTSGTPEELGEQKTLLK